MKRFEVTIESKSPLLMHWDNIDFAELLKKWREDPANQKYSVRGDDRSPAFSWLGCLYNDGSNVAVPGDNIMRALMEGGASVPVPGGKGGKTFKAQTQSGMAIDEEYWTLLIDGKPISMAPLTGLMSENDFTKHQEVAAESRFSLFVKRAKIGASKHVRVRPRFDRWSLRGLVNVWDEQIKKDALQNILSAAGSYKGLGDWRPSSRTPGPYGRFSATVKEV